MSVIKKLSRLGNSSALLLDKTTMDHLGLKEGGEVQLTFSGNSLIITGSTGNTAPDEMVDAAAAQVIKEYSPSLKRLAKR